MIGFGGFSDKGWGSLTTEISFSATSPGITSTDTQRSATARRMAISIARGICAGLETSSQ